MADTAERFWPEVLQAVPGKDFTVYAYCNDGSVRLLDIKPLIRPGTVFEALGDPARFRDKLTVIHGTVAWDMSGCRNPAKCIDLDPFVIFQAPVVADPLVEESGKTTPEKP